MFSAAFVNSFTARRNSAILQFCLSITRRYCVNTNERMNDVVFTGG